LDQYDNLVILRTFSKALSVPGLRCGVLLGDAELVRALGTLQLPWQLPAYSIMAAQEVLAYRRESSWVEERVEQVKAEREQLRQACLAADEAGVFTVFPSAANFMLLRADTPERHQALLAACTETGVLVSDLDALPRLERCVRVTVGQPEHHELFLKAFRGALA
jgi:histidinol-phosphate aminotransferase